MIQKELKINRISYTVSSKQTVRYNYDNTGLFISFFNKRDLMLCFVFNHDNTEDEDNEYIFKTYKNKTNLDLNDDKIKQIINDLTVNVNDQMNEINNNEDD